MIIGKTIEELYSSYIVITNILKNIVLNYILVELVLK